ncbi:uncharacterized protein LOC118749769 [Rhagoletis pomonella]|uniref:uncharacterized protein LOC118749769 n=1 Tax=Rhagoletis pomonella TaxID=28610 RepID=UPI00178594E4|nr:uncharacterized protein LOC118749769 [Rhagoletis pomonella]
MMEIEASGSQGTSGVRNVTRKYLFDRMQAQNSPNLDEKLNSLQQELLSSEKYSDEQISALKHNFSHFKSQIKKKWLQVQVQLYVELYPWHPMTPTMHKILVHGALIIKNALVPIGQLSDEAAEFLLT